MGRRQMVTMEALGGIDQFGKPRVGSFSQGRGRNQGDKPGAGPAGNCICPSCGVKVPHTVNQPCNEVDCPKCGTKMTRE